MGCKSISWNFLESDHGKGPPDGIGGVLKRTADSVIVHGKDIADPQAFYNALSCISSSMKPFFVSENGMSVYLKNCRQLLAR